MNIIDARHAALDRTHTAHLRWHGDNSKFVVESLLPFMALRPEVRQVIRWAYGYDGAWRNWELSSDGSSVVDDAFLNSIIKEPPGVAHDMLYGTPFHKTPDGHKWTRYQADWWYWKALKDFGYPAWRCWLRFVGLRIGGFGHWEKEAITEPLDP